MPFVVCEPCRGCKYTDCVTVCPMDCFYQDGQMLYIDADECIDCGACVPECPVEAIYFDQNVPEKWVEYVELNVRRSKELIALGAPRVTEKQEPLAGR